jgi:hypothetical protein
MLPWASDVTNQMELRPAKMTQTRAPKSYNYLPFLSTHSHDHFFAELHWRWKRLWVSAENETKINMEKTPIFCEEKVV